MHLNGWLRQLKIPRMVLNTVGNRGFFSRATRSFRRVLARGQHVFGGRLKKREAKPREKTSGAERLDLLCYMDLDLVSTLSIKPAVSYGDNMYKHTDGIADLDFVTVSVTAVCSDGPKWLSQESKQLP